MAEPMSERITILLVEDEQSDIAIVRKSLQSGDSNSQLASVNTAKDALAYLRGEAPYSPAPPEPGLVLLDLSLPDGSGHDLLKEIRQDARLRHIPVVVLTGRQDAESASKSYALGANAHVVKPMDVSHFVRLVNTLDNFWMSLVSHPQPAKPS